MLRESTEQARGGPRPISRGLCLVAAGVIAALGLTERVQSQELIASGSFDSGTTGWRNQMEGSANIQSDWLRAAGRNNSGCVHIRSEDPAPQTCWIWRYVLREMPADKSLRVSGWVKGKDVAKIAAICVQGWNADRSRLVAFATTQTTNPLAGDFDWTRIETYFVPSTDTKDVHILIFISGTGEVWFDDISAVTVEPAEAAAASGMPVPGLFEARGAYRATGLSRASRATLLLPLPISYREQVPLTYEISASPDGSLASVRIYRDKLRNYVAEVVLEPLDSSSNLELEWRSIVVCGPRSFDDLPATAPRADKWPESVRPWLRSTRCVQADDERIQAVAREIRGDRDDVLAIISATLERTREIFAGQQGRCTNLDAVQALEKQGSCTSCANLVAALLRANGIPARILAGYPTNGRPLQTHYIVEAYVPAYGWYPIESTRLRAPWPPHQQVEVAIIPPEYEDRSERRISAAGGVPYLSLTERTEAAGWMVVGTVDAERYCDHVADVRQPFPGNTSAADWALAVERADARWQAWLDSSPTLDEHHRFATPLTADEIDAENARELAELLESG